MHLYICMYSINLHEFVKYTVIKVRKWLSEMMVECDKALRCLHSKNVVCCVRINCLKISVVA
jgi:hypothetical protein